MQHVWHRVCGVVCVALCVCVWRHVCGIVCVASCVWHHVCGIVCVVSCVWHHVWHHVWHLCDVTGLRALYVLEVLVCFLWSPGPMTRHNFNREIRNYSKQEYMNN